MEKKIDLRILEAIKTIVEGTDSEITFDVNKFVDKKPFSKDGIKKTIVTIVMSERI